MNLINNLGVAMDAYCTQKKINRNLYDVALIDGKQVIQSLSERPIPSNKELEIALTQYEVEKKKEDLKLSGFKFEGVMCSATKIDQNTFVYIAYKFQSLAEKFKDTTFVFKNGNSLVITKDNFLKFESKWIAFRDQFFDIET